MCFCCSRLVFFLGWYIIFWFLVSLFVIVIFFLVGEINLIGKFIDGRYFMIREIFLVFLRRGELVVFVGRFACFNEFCLFRYSLIWEEIF